MKNIKFLYSLLFFLLYMFICFITPTFINGKFENTILKEDEYTNLSGDIIKVLITHNNTIIDIDFEEYIKGVLIGEMPVTYELEALKAQAVVARTYALYKYKNSNVKHEGGADMCDDINCCQAYKSKEYALQSWDDTEENDKWQKINDAVHSTASEVILYSGEIINAFFHANSGGKTENVKFMWSNEEIPYLVSVAGNEVDLRQDIKSFSKDEFKNLINSEVPNYKSEDEIKIIDYTGSGRVNNLSIGNININANKLRNLLGIKSTNFRIEISGDKITFYTIGYGHGVGMSQDGANQMALEGRKYNEIIKHYYTGVDLGKMNI